MRKLLLVALLAALLSAQALAAEPASNMKWETTKLGPDKMTGKTSLAMTLTSDTVLDFGFPYGKVWTQLVLAQTFGEKRVSAGMMTKAQFNCNSECTVLVKFDDGAIQRYKAKGSTELGQMIHIKGDTKVFVENVKKSKHIIIQADFFKHPGQQLEFSAGEIGDKMLLGTPAVSKKQ